MSSKSFKKIKLSSEMCFYASKCKLLSEIKFCNFYEFYLSSLCINYRNKTRHLKNILRISVYSKSVDSIF